MALITESITEQLYKIIRERILLQEYEAGSKLNMREIADEHDISIMPVRDALKQLANQGLVKKNSRVGFFVRDFSEKEINDIMELRMMYELYCIKNHFDNIDKEKLEKLLHKIKSVEEWGRKDFDRLDGEIHDLFIQASGNNHLLKNYYQIKDYIVLLRNMDKARIEQANREHCRVLEAIMEDDREKAARELSKHINTVRDSIDQTLKGEEGEQEEGE